MNEARINERITEELKENLKMPVVITFASWKGGTGKTTLQAAAIHLLSEMNFKIGIIDLDSNLSMTNCFNFENQNFTSFEFLSGIPGTFSKMTDNIDIIPSRLELSKLANMSENELKTRLSKLDLSGYDYIFIDPPGTMNALTRNALCAADKIIVPGLVSPQDYNATALIFDELDMMNIEADITVVINNVDNKKTDQDIIKQYQDEYEGFIYSENITNMKSMVNMTKNVFKYKLNGQAKSKIERFVNEVIL